MISVIRSTIDGGSAGAAVRSSAAIDMQVSS
jgi:hypothetical protein